MTHLPYRVIGLWEESHWKRIYKLLEDVDSKHYTISDKNHMSVDGQSRRNVVVRDEDLADQLAQVGDARIYYRIRTTSMSLAEHKKIGKIMWRNNISCHVSISYAVDQSINNAVWGIADKSMATYVKLKWGGK